MSYFKILFFIFFINIHHHSQAQEQDLIYQLNQINHQVNEFVTYENDTEDIWQTPEETLWKKTGDCEDYAILKYYELLIHGFDIKKMKLRFIKTNFDGYIKSHMVLMYENYIMDNLTDLVVDIDKRKDITHQVADFSLNENLKEAIYLYHGVSIEKINPFMKKWEIISKKILETKTPSVVFLQK